LRGLELPNATNRRQPLATLILKRRTLTGAAFAFCTAVAKITLPKCPRRNRRPWTAAQTRSFLDAAADDPLGAYWIVQPLTGMRPSEGLALMWGDVDLERGALRVSRSLKPVKKKASSDGQDR
jgi:integrase